MNLLIDDTDHPLVIKVASIPTARMQVYFIDNDEYFKPGQCCTMRTTAYSKTTTSAPFSSQASPDREEVGLGADIIHCNGWMTAAVQFT